MKVIKKEFKGVGECVQVSSIPEPERSEFRKFMFCQTIPMFTEEEDPYDWVYSWDWDNFLHKKKTGRAKFWD